jgi:hypothetical protein
MIWAVVVLTVVIVAAVSFFLKGRRNRRNDVYACPDAHSAESFYPESEKCHEINTRAITCSCKDFRKEREQFRHDDPRRLCKHLTKSFADAKSLPEDLILYKEGIERSARGHRGFPADRAKFDELIGGKRVSIMSPKEITEEDPWVDVYCDSKRYGYSPGREAWADDMAPPREEQIIRFLCGRLGKPIPEALLKRLKTFQHVTPDVGERESLESANREPGLYYDVEAVLRTLLPRDGELTIEETRSHVTVAFQGARTWICRLCMRSGTPTHIEFPHGRRYELAGMEDIATYKELLMEAYRENSHGKGKTRPLFPMSETGPSGLSELSAKSGDTPNKFSRN